MSHKHVTQYNYNVQPVERSCELLPQHMNMGRLPHAHVHIQHVFMFTFLYTQEHGFSVKAIAKNLLCLGKTTKPYNFFSNLKPC